MIAAIALLAGGLVVDGAPASIGPIEGELDCYLAPLARSVEVLSAGTVHFRREGPTKGTLRGDDGATLMTLPLAPDGTAPKAIASVEGAAKPIPVGTVPYEIEVEGKKTLVADVQEIAGWLGAGFMAGNDGYEAYTPRGWETMLGLPSRVGTPPMDLAADLGVSPPALQMVVWARVRKPAWVQIYALSDGVPRPMLGLDPLTGQRSSGTDGLIVRPWSVPENGSFRLPFAFGKKSAGETGLYAALFLRNDPGDADPVEAIAKGRILAKDYCVVGVGQRIAASPVVFETDRLHPNENVVRFADRHKVDVSLLRAMNGLVSGETVAAGTALTYPSRLAELPFTPGRSVVKATGYAVGGETVESLAAKWKVPEEDVRAANPGFDTQETAVPGTYLTVLAPKMGNTPPLARKPVKGTGVLKTALALRQGPKGPDLEGKLPAGGEVEIMDEAGPNYLVAFGGRVGFVAKSSLTDVDLRQRIKQRPPVPGQIPERPYVAANVSPIVRTALRYYGTPYVWGGASLTRGIDCSHFVAEALREAGVACPPPPVLSQESRGPLVHWKEAGMVTRRNGGNWVMPAYPARIDRLRPGDRVIIQRGLTDAPKSRHTGIYAGALRFRGRNYAHAVIHASCSRGITMDEITASWIWKDYKFSLGTGGG